MALAIQLSRNRQAIIDDEDFEKLNKYKWYISTKGYAIAHTWKNGKRTTMTMHRIIMKSPTRGQIDHKNNDKLDNQKINLRLCNTSQNKANSLKHHNNKSGYKGVNWHKRDKIWYASICLNYKKYSLGYFKNKIEAAKAYDKRALELFGEFANLNFKRI